MSATTRPRPAIEFARGYTARGWRVVPIPYRSKRPILDGWQRLRLDQDKLASYFDGHPVNVGVLLGEPSAGLIDVDLDAPQAVALADEFLPPTASRFGRASKRSSHCLYVASPLVPTGKFKDVEKAGENDRTTMLVEVRSTGAQTVFPDSVHPSGEVIEWESDDQPAMVTAEELLQSVTHLAVATILARHWPDTGARDEAAMAVAGELLRAGLDEELVGRVVRGAARAAQDEEWRARGSVVEPTANKLRAGEPTTGRPRLAELLRGDGEKVLRRIQMWLNRRGARPVPSTARSVGDQEPARPTFTVSGDLVGMTADAWPAIETINTQPVLFRRGAVPVRLERDDDGTPMTRPLTPDRMRHALARASRWEVSRGQKVVEVLPPVPVVLNLLATPEPPLPVLDRIVEVPTFTPSGFLRREPGYDPDGRTYFEPPPGLIIPSVPERPTPAEIAAAKTLLLEDLLGGFRFIGPSDRAHAVALVLLPFLRELIDGATPLHDVEAPVPGSGKTLLVDVALSPALGRPVPTMAEGRDDDEWRKRISAKLFAAAAIIFLDNLRRRLDSSAVAAAITSPRWEDRVLGRSEIHTVPVRCVWVSSANNPAFSLEIARRSIRIRIDSGLEQPWLRTGFRHENLRAWSRENRGRLISAALTLGRAWLDAGRPTDGVKRLGMFESWASVIGGVLQVAGIEGFLSNLDDFYTEADTETAEVRDLLDAWWEKHQNKPVTATELLTLPVLPGPVLEAPEDKRARRLGTYLGGLRDRRLKLGENGPTVFVSRGKRDPRSRAMTWQLRAEGA